MTPKKSSDDKRDIKTDKSYIEGSANIKAGDFVGGDKIGLQPDEITRLVETIVKNLTPYYRNPERFDTALLEFQNFHKALYEWKELHNLLDEIINSFNQYYSQVERLNGSSSRPNLQDLRLLWLPVSKSVTELVEFAKNITLIGVPYTEDQGQLKGERWVLEILSLRNGLEKIFYPDEQTSLKFYPREVLSFGTKPQWWNIMYELTRSFHHTTSICMSLADKKLRDSATDLYHLSESVFQRQLQ